MNRGCATRDSNAIGAERSSESNNVGHHGARTVDYPLQKPPQAVLPCMSWFVGIMRRTLITNAFTVPQV
ncbi:hypothetical protein RRSWK_06622 [Rhodopirellula sp. SWK7]|nr:hypothetical protein RRSWK_06622 [Rhodopirellula sp. SWK7]